ncbi:unnamed protein product [Cylindrotheca closterium]|uniref:Uncharacterized protein n=1 Tax=Cylindrotheca closterium TaxID=2856 RepID=A0AAD2CLB3_9STRA|nr:unnamed protein product [Cylindrotheca closterium]
MHSLPSSLLHIGPSAFGYCYRLKHADLPDGLQTIERNAFMDCLALVTIRIPWSVTTIAEQTFNGCMLLRSLELPPTLNTVGFGAFRDCSSLVNICLPTTVEELPRHSFSYCTPLLTKFSSSSNPLLLQALQTRFDELPLHKLCYYQSYYYFNEEESSSRDDLLSELQEILRKDDEDSSGDDTSCLLKKDALGMNPFHVLALSARPNKDLLSVLLNHAQRRFTFTSSGNAVSEDVLAKTDDSGNDLLTYACRNMSPGSGEQIARFLKVVHAKSIAQLGCHKWRSKIHSEIDGRFVGDELLSGGGEENNSDTTFASRQRRTKQVDIELDAFAWCKALENHADLPDGLQTIERNAFMDCLALVTIRIPWSVTTIAEQTFNGCMLLRSLELPPTLNTVGFGAFRDCSSLVNICLPTTVEELPRHSFSYCTPLLTKFSSSSNPLLLQALQTRFDELPLHKLCYYQSYYYFNEEESSSRDDLLSELQEILRKDDEDSSGDDTSCLLKKDALGMNPFHVLALSARPNKDLLSVLLNHAQRRFTFTSSGNAVSEDVLAKTDDSGNDLLTYACRNMSPGSGEQIARFLKVVHAKSIAQLGCHKWRSKIHSEIDGRFVGDELLSGGGEENNSDTTFASRQRRTKQVDKIIHRYIMKERVALLELAIWDQSLSRCVFEKTITNPRGREDCRTASRSNVIVSRVVDFLYPSLE